MAGGPRVFRVSDAGLAYEARFTGKTVRDALLPLTGRIRAVSERGDTRALVCVSGPPGSGKSTIAHTLVSLLVSSGRPARVLPLDGFHLTNRELESRFTVMNGEKVPLARIKGAPETYDTERLLRDVRRLRRGDTFRWPAYSRKTHEPVDRGPPIDHTSVYIFEGNYLLLDEEPWRSLRDMYDFSLFIVPIRRVLKKRILSRKMRGGYSRRQARRHFETSDRRNIDRVLGHSCGWDAVLVQTGRYAFRAAFSGETARASRREARPPDRRPAR